MEKKIELLSFSAGADCTTLAIVGNAVSAEVPVRIQRSRKHKQVSPNGLPIVYVGRGSRWGNPFRLVKYSDGKWAITVGCLAKWLCGLVLSVWKPFCQTPVMLSLRFI